MTETVFWTLVFFGIDAGAVVVLITMAIRNDRRKAQQDT